MSVKGCFALQALLAAPFLFSQSASTPPADAHAAKSDTDSPVTLDVFEVSSKQDRGYKSASAVSATRLDTPLSDVPQFVTVFNEDFIKDINATELKDILIYDPAINPTSEKDDIMVRGFNGANSTARNGFSQLTQGNMTATVTNTSRIEVLKGPAAILYGTGAYGGTINRVYKPASLMPFATSRVVVGSGPLYRGELELGGPLRGFAWLPQLQANAFSYRLGATLQNGKGWGGLTRDEMSIVPELTWRIGPDTTVIGSFNHVEQTRMGGWQLPVHDGDPYGLKLGDGSYRRFDRRIRYWQPGNERENTNNLGDLDFRHRFSDRFQFRAQFQMEDNDQNFYETQVDNSSLIILKDTALMGAQYRINPDGAQAFRTRDELVFQIGTGKINHRGLVGFAWNQSYSESKQWVTPINRGGVNNSQLFVQLPNVTRAEFYSNPAAYGFNAAYILPADIWDPRGTEVFIPAGGPYPAPLFLNTWTHARSENRSYYFSDLISLFNERLFLQIGDRYTIAKSYSINRVTGSFPTTSRYNTSAPKVWSAMHGNTHSEGLVYHIRADKTLTVYANLNTAFNPRNAAPNPDGETFPPEQGEQKEAGLKMALLDGRISVLASCYEILQVNLLASDPDRGEGYRKLIDGVRSQGAEFNINGNLSRGWQFFGGYAYTDSRNDVTGLVQFAQPKHGISAFSRYQVQSGPLRGFALSCGMVYRSEAQAQPATTRGEPGYITPSYWKFDGGLSYRRKIGGVDYEAAIFVRNIGDNLDIFLNATNSRLFTSPGREWMSSLTARF